MGLIFIGVLITFLFLSFELISLLCDYRYFIKYHTITYRSRKTGKVKKLNFFRYLREVSEMEMRTKSDRLSSYIDLTIAEAKEEETAKEGETENE